MKKKIILIFSAVVFLTTCGIDEYYYLPQVSQGDILSNVTSADIYIPSIDHLYYATGYRIFYRIYTSDFDYPIGGSISRGQMSNINSALSRDFDNLYRIADPTSNTVTSASTFRDYRYYELEIETGNINLILTKYGGTLSIRFVNNTGVHPVLSINGGSPYRLYRTNNRGAFTLEPDEYFFRSSELENVETNVNGDVSRSGLGYAYVSMYIVAAGINPENFSNIYSKPTHISIFKLPDK
jgi:hypothetical protein